MRISDNQTVISGDDDFGVECRKGQVFVCSNCACLFCIRKLLILMKTNHVGLFCGAFLLYRIVYTPNGLLSSILGTTK